MAKQKSICSPNDTRALSDNQKIGRGLVSLNKNISCTVTLISNSCIISAGHCFDNVNLVEFNVPLSIEKKFQNSDQSDIYELDKSFFKYENTGEGDDFLVAKLLPNKISGKLPGAIQGFYEMEFSEIDEGSEISITGYGASKFASRHGVQQIAYGNLIANFEKLLAYITGSAYSFGSPNSTIVHNVDTTGGVSGAALIDITSDKVIGVHTSGECRGDSKRNYATSLSRNKKFKEYVKLCLESEK